MSATRECSAADDAELTPAETAALDDLVWLATGPHTAREVAARLGFSPSYVRHLTQVALEKLRKRLPGGRTAW